MQKSDNMVDNIKKRGFGMTNITQHKCQKDKKMSQPNSNTITNQDRAEEMPNFDALEDDNEIKPQIRFEDFNICE